MKHKLLGKILKKITGRIGEFKNLQTLSLCALILMLFPTMVFASSKKFDHTFKYEDYTQGTYVDNLDTCVKWSLEKPEIIIKCGINSEPPGIWGVHQAPHYYWRGKMVDNDLDKVSEQIFLNEQAAETKQIKSNQAFISGLLIISIIVIISVVGFICWGLGVVVVFFSIPDLLLNVGIPILGGIIVFVGNLCSENGHLYGINFSYHDIQVFLLIWFSLWFIWNAVQAFRHNNVFLALLALVSRITTPVFIVIIWSWVASAIDRFVNHGCKK